MTWVCDTRKRWILARLGVLVAAGIVFVSVATPSQDGGERCARRGTDFNLSRYTIDCGGAMRSTGGDFELSGTIGQPDAGGPMVGGEFELSGGFWFQVVPAVCNSDGGVNLLDYDAFEECLVGPVGGPSATECVCFDLNGNGKVDLIDFALFQGGFSD